MDDQEEPLLTDLCRICNISIPRYRCPRCSTRTCSLACSKRHKAWSQCSGLRDPAAYAKRDELATPSGIDRDFNYLVDLERKLDVADKDVEQRGISLGADEDSKPWLMKTRDPRKGEAQIENAVRECGVVVERAPKGMQRSRENGTHWNKKRRCIQWTVEWIDASRSRDLDCFAEIFNVGDAHGRFLAEHKRGAQKRKIDSGKDRTHISAVTTVKSSATHFYLLKPHTRSPKRVLIPLSPQWPLKQCLRGRTVLEFPTIYALDDPPSTLPKDFMSEAQYLGRPEPDLELSELLTVSVADIPDKAVSPTISKQGGTVICENPVPSQGGDGKGLGNRQEPETMEIGEVELTATAVPELGSGVIDPEPSENVASVISIC